LGISPFKGLLGGGLTAPGTSKETCKGIGTKKRVHVNLPPKSPSDSKNTNKLAKEAQSQSWELHELRTSSGAADGEVTKRQRILGIARSQRTSSSTDT